MNSHLTGKMLDPDITQVSVLIPILFVIYVKDLSQGLHANIKLFADNLSLSPGVDSIYETASKINNDLIRAQDETYNWKMTFNIERVKPA